MRSKSQLQQNRTARDMDGKSERAKQFLPFLQKNKINAVKFRLKAKRQLFKFPTETRVRRYDESNGITVLNIRFASAEPISYEQKDDEAYISNMKRAMTELNEQQNQGEGLLPYLRSRKFNHPQQYLKNVGYNSDIRIATEVYSDKIQEKKVKYINKMQALKRELENCTGNKRQSRMQRCRIQVKILGQQIRRKKQRQILAQEERKGHRMLLSLLNPINQNLTV